MLFRSEDHKFIDGHDGIPIPNPDHAVNPEIFARNIDRKPALQRIIPRQKSGDDMAIKALIKKLHQVKADLNSEKAK